MWPLLNLFKKSGDTVPLKRRSRTCLKVGLPMNGCSGPLAGRYQELAHLEVLRQVLSYKGKVRKKSTRCLLIVKSVQ